jgi:hypothetical protein
MEDVRGKYVSPAVDQLAFNCPHCGALAKQFWFAVDADQLKTDEWPYLATALHVERLKRADIEPEPYVLDQAERMASGSPFLERRQKLTNHEVHNVSIAGCFNCNDITIWIYDQLFWPRRPAGPRPNLTFRLTSGATTRRQARYWTPLLAAQRPSFVWQWRSFAKSLVKRART